jgi:hypothetical protein
MLEACVILLTGLLLVGAFTIALLSRILAQLGAIDRDGPPEGT